MKSSWLYFVIITKTPYRISLFGGGSDYKAYYEHYGGAVLTTTIDRYCYISLRNMPPFLGSRYRIMWSRMENVDKIDDIKHPGVRGCLQYLGVSEGIEVNHAGDLPARSGLGSSSAFTVGMLHALHVLRGEEVSRAMLAKEAIEVEQNILMETVGIQDQIECAWGGLNYIEIGRDGSYAVRPVLVSDAHLQRLQEHLVLVFTDIQRHASEIAKAQVENVDRKRNELHKILSLVPRGLHAVMRGDLAAFGELLHEAWMLKRELSNKVTNAAIDEIYAKARHNGAIGGKLLGAGGGGFMVVCVPPERREQMLSALGLHSVPVRFEHGGSKVVLR